VLIAASSRPVVKLVGVMSLVVPSPAMTYSFENVPKAAHRVPVFVTHECAPRGAALSVVSPNPRQPPIGCKAPSRQRTKLLSRHRPDD
jgi:hypothetical protein